MQKEIFSDLPRHNILELCYVLISVCFPAFKTVPDSKVKNHSIEVSSWVVDWFKT